MINSKVWIFTDGGQCTELMIASNRCHNHSSLIMGRINAKKEHTENQLEIEDFKQACRMKVERKILFRDRTPRRGQIMGVRMLHAYTKTVREER